MRSISSSWEYLPQGVWFIVTAIQWSPIHHGFRWSNYGMLGKIAMWVIMGKRLGFIHMDTHHLKYLQFWASNIYTLLWLADTASFRGSWITARIYLYFNFSMFGNFFLHIFSYFHLCIVKTALYEQLSVQEKLGGRYNLPSGTVKECIITKV